MRKFLFTILLLIAAGACNKETPGKDILPAETLVPVLVDFHLVNAIQTKESYRKILIEYDSIETYSYVFNKYNITRAEFDSSISWYSSHPKLFSGIYDEVIMRLTRLVDSLDPNLD